MGTTYTPNEALSIVSGHIRSMTIAAAITTMLHDQVNSIIWRAYPWRWSLGTLTAISLVDGTQDYSIAGADTNIYRHVRLRITRTDLTPDQSRPLDIVNHLEPELVRKTSPLSFEAIAWEPDISKLRLECAASIGTGVTATINGEYQKNPTKIITAVLASALPFPDQYFDVYCEGLLYKIYKYADDDRAGTLQVTKNGYRQYTGQLAVFHAALQEMAEAEDHGDGNDFIFPAEPLGVGRGYQDLRLL